jgi:hypothetical protein
MYAITCLENASNFVSTLDFVSMKQFQIFTTEVEIFHANTSLTGEKQHWAHTYKKEKKKQNTILKTKVMSNTESTKRKAGERYEFYVSYQTLPVLLIVKSGRVLSMIEERMLLFSNFHL